ncbi:MAG: hypothetical protein RL033_1777, partial [Pseudomonadota bacterium]
MTDLHPLAKLLQSRIAIIDGAVGTTLRTYGVTEADIRGNRFKDSKKDLLNNGDLFSLTQPKVIGDIHRRFLEAGADIIETNTFTANQPSQADYGMQALVGEINLAAARLARTVADDVIAATGSLRFVAGALGPTNR